MVLRTFRTLALPVAISALASGCFVATARFEEKVAESDSLRDALAAANREKNSLSGRHDALQKQFADMKDTAENCAVKSKGQEAELSRVNAELANAKRSYEGTRITREELITELMEKEKATGKRIQELSARAQAGEAELEKARREIDRAAKEISARDARVAELQEQLGKAQGDEGLRRERDTLLGRIERFTEDRKEEEKRRDARFEAAAAKLRDAAPPAAVASAGGVLRISLPEKALLKAGGQELAEPGKAATDESAGILSEFPAARLVVNAVPDGKAMKAVLAALADGGKVPAERIVRGTREKDGGVELLLIVP
jgi:DNA repair exonuclease SbcCD ATPase subunit